MVRLNTSQLPVTTRMASRNLLASLFESVQCCTPSAVLLTMHAYARWANLVPPYWLMAPIVTMFCPEGD